MRTSHPWASKTGASESTPISPTIGRAAFFVRVLPPRAACAFTALITGESAAIAPQLCATILASQVQEHERAAGAPCGRRLRAQHLAHGELQARLGLLAVAEIGFRARGQRIALKRHDALVRRIA